MVCLNAQYYYPWFYQVFLLCAVWALPDIGMVTMWRCGVYSLNMQCDNRSYFIAFAAAVANPTLALLSLSQNRLVAIFGAVQLFCLQAGLLFNRIDLPNSFYRDCTFGTPPSHESQSLSLTVQACCSTDSSWGSRSFANGAVGSCSKSGNSSKFSTAPHSALN